MNAPFPKSPSKSGEDWLDQLIREDARAHVNDAGFTDAFMQTLPPPKRGVAWLRWLPGLMTGAAAVLAVGILPGSDVFLDGVADLIASDLTSPRVVAMIGTVVVFIAAVATAVSSER
jgi:hypothetical protein